MYIISPKGSKIICISQKCPSTLDTECGAVNYFHFHYITVIAVKVNAHLLNCLCIKLTYYRHSSNVLNFCAMTVMIFMRAEKSGDKI